MEVSSIVRERIEEILRKNKYTNNTLSNLSGVSRTTIESFLYNDGQKITIRSLLNICIGLNVLFPEFFNTKEFKKYNFEIENKEENKNLPKLGIVGDYINLTNAVIQKIITLAEYKNMSLTDIKNNSKIKYSTLRSFLSGDKKEGKTTTIDTLYEICRGLKVSLFEFFDDEVFTIVIDEYDRKESKAKKNKSYHK